MGINFRNYSPEPFFTEDYLKVREFLIRINFKKLHVSCFLWGAWEWAITHAQMDRDNLCRFGLWEDCGELIAIAIYEGRLGEGLLIVDEAYAQLKPEMVAYAKKALHNDGKLRLLLPDGDFEFQRTSIAQGFRPTQEKWCTSVLDISDLQSYDLPEGFSFVSMADGWNWQQYNRVMRRSFRGEENPPCDDKTIAERKLMLSSPMINPELVLAVTAPDGSYVSHCGVWYRPGEFYCYAEPVATDPDYRKMGLGKAVVLEAARRCGELGAKQAVVGSAQQFYYNIGFYPVHTMTYWELY